MNSIVSTFSESSLATGFPRSATLSAIPYCLTDLPIHKTKILFSDHDLFNNKTVLSKLVIEVKNGVFNYAVGAFSPKAIPLSTWVPLLDAVVVKQSLNEACCVLAEIKQDISAVEFDIQTQGSSESLQLELSDFSFYGSA